jgi:hypothetical protein
MSVRRGGLEPRFDDVERTAQEDAGGAGDVAVVRMRLIREAGVGFGLWGEHTPL